MSNSGFYAIPPEIIPFIVANIHTDSSLRNISLVASQFTEPCQRQLFREVILRPTAERPAKWISYTEAAAHLRAFPRLADYVKTLKLHLRDWGKQTCDLTDDDIRALVGLLNLVQRTTAVTVMSATWTQLPETLRAPLSNFIDHVIDTKQRLTLSDLRGTPIDLVYRTLRSCQVLSLVNLGVDSDGDALKTLDAADSFATRPADSNSHLRRLTLRNAVEIYSLLLQPTFLQLIQSLRELSVHESASPAIAGALVLVRTCAASLEKLSIAYSTDLVQSNLTDRLPPHLPKLRELQLAFWERASCISSSWVLPECLDSMLSHADLPSLERIQVHFAIKVPKAATEVATHTLPEESMASLDRTLERYLNGGIVVEFRHYVFNRSDASSPNVLSHVAPFTAALERDLPNAMRAGLSLLKWDGNWEL
ncbi:hypothetical protein HMN09_00941300 [Mycena chlorophos]|uniref:Uncharacterized protein n=1 Tax=Mycena chlorophos TaxID=658473 RepID=A0A8H6W604_MYCCL|nr:hypothetical protein HMN09_00941300 [Mycena chlorophos]